MSCGLHSTRMIAASTLPPRIIVVADISSARRLQPLQATRQKQMQMWAHYILEYCQFHKVYTLDLLESTPVFRNDAIGRTLGLRSNDGGDAKRVHRCFD